MPITPRAVHVMIQSLPSFFMQLTFHSGFNDNNDIIAVTFQVVKHGMC